MGCNNLGQCVAIGYPDTEDNNEQKWYIKVEWNNNKDNGNLLLSFFIDHSVNLPLKFCYYEEKCDDISVKNIEKNHIWGKRKYLETEIQKTDLRKYQHILFQSELKIPKLELEGFLENYQNQEAKFEIKLQNSRTIYNWENFRYIGADELKNLHSEVLTEDVCSKGILLNYENGDNILFVSECEDLDFDKKISYNVYRDKGNGYELFPFITITDENEIAEKLGYGFVYVNGAIDPFVDPYNKDTINISNMSGLWLCGNEIRLVYDGEKFIVDSINVMPFCSNIIQHDWISIYKRKLFLKE